MGDFPASIVANLPLSVNALGFNDDERLFVGLSAFGDGLYEVDPEGVAPPRLIVAEAGQPNSFDFGPDDGLLYAPLFARGEVARFDVDAGTQETVAGGFVLPVSAKFDADGELYVNDGALGHVIRVDRVTGEKEIFADTGF